MSHTKPLLYTYFRSSASWRVRIALAYKCIEYEPKFTSLIEDGGKQNTIEYQTLNPMRQLPTLIIDGHTLTQSLPIIEYLEETRPEKPLLPKDPYSRAQVRRVAEIINSGIQPMQNLSVINKVEEWTSKEKKIEWANYWINRAFVGLEKTLEKTSGKYCCGDEVTIADLCLVPQIFGANRFNVDMAQFPIISRIYEECMNIEAFQVADQARQPECPEHLRK